MIFLSLLFITLYLASLLKGSLFYNTIKQNYELEIKRLEGSIKQEEYISEVIKHLFTLLLAITWIVLMIMFYIYALDIEQLKTVSIIMIGYSVYSLVKGIVSNKQAKSEKEKLENFKMKLYTLKKRTVLGTFMNACHLSYFILAFYVLVFQ